MLFKCHRPEAAGELAQHTRAALGEHTPALWLGAPADDASMRSWDLALRASFANAEALAAWLQSAEYTRWHTHLAEPASVVIKAWSFVDR